MNKNETKDICEHCEEAPVTEIVHLGWRELTPALLCEPCIGNLRECEYSGTLHTLDSEMHELDDGMIVCDGVRESECSICDWTDDLCLTSQMLVLCDGELISRNCRDDTAICYESGERYHIDEMVYNEEYGEWFHIDCAPAEAERWYRRFSHIISNNFAKFPVRNFVGIEFEAEDGETILQDTWTQKYIAEAKEDGSLSCGTEYTTHPMRGDDIANTVDEMCERFENGGFTLGSNVGWHFHYEAQKFGTKAQKNIWTAIGKFQDAFMGNSHQPGWAYFADMIRGYSEAWSNPYRDWVRAWANTQAQYTYADHYRRYQPSSASSPRAFANFTPMRRDEGRRIEIRMYYPCRVLRECKDYAELAEDYKSFIRFWDELIRKAAYRFNDLRFPDEMDGFARQFSVPTREWLTNKEKK